MGKEALDRLRKTEPAEYLSPSSELSRLARAASSHLYSSLVPFCSSKPPLDQLLSEESFDAEQIWSQIDLLSKPLLPFLRRHLSRLEKESKLQSLLPRPTLKSTGKAKEDGDEEEEVYSEELELDDEEEEGDEDEENEEEKDEDEEKDEEEGEAKGVEDKFLKIKELEKFLEDGEAKEYGLPVQNNNIDLDDKDNESDQDEEDDDEEDAFDLEDLDGDSDEEVANEMENARYEDFFGRQSNKGAQKKSSSKKVKFDDRPQVKEIEYQETDDENENENDENNLSTHQKESAKLRSTIEEMERANLEPKGWTMIGEVTAGKRPVNSALEVDLDFEHNVKPAPVITEEVTASIEELIKKRIIDGRFDDVERASTLPTKAPRELKEMDESKSKKGLAEIYEEEYAQTAGLAAAPISVSDDLKKEAEMLFKKICSKLDALSHFHFAPKPVIEDMSIQANVPALAMEEIAPIAVSDAAMLAPEEIFEGKGDIKEERELSRSDRKRRRANKKQRFKTDTVKRAAKKPRPTTDANGNCI
ncbi:U3 small nucleolar ribonucleoprotein MPP10 isoform X2 [Carex littledalei]|uniref:U3 small nucleolar ribonucleoprotein protein MPP10 n=1 Tax=Carex littledalei TaxID=544730 RepID=A0A833VG00_9POAL|nr:U3 small nucleolar ribonucleoprotein MPP10 isoform X2 [Carex littledalei]